MGGDFMKIIFEIFLSIFKIGAFTFGGGYAVPGIRISRESYQARNQRLLFEVRRQVWPYIRSSRPPSESEGIPGMEGKPGGICGVYSHNTGPEGQGASDGTTGRPIGEQFYFPTGSPSRSNRPDPE